MNEPVVVFDIDDTLWPLTEYVASKVGIDYSKLTSYRIEENTGVTPEQVKQVVELYSTGSTYKNIPWYNGVRRINSLKADVRISSNNLNEEVAAVKTEELTSVLDLPVSKITMNIIGEDYTYKKLPTSMFILVEDSPYNIARSKATHNILIKAPFNTSEHSMGIIRANTSSELHICDTLNDAIDLIERLLEEEASV